MENISADVMYVRTRKNKQLFQTERLYEQWLSKSLRFHEGWINI